MQRVVEEKLAQVRLLVVGGLQPMVSDRYQMLGAFVAEHHLGVRGSGYFRMIGEMLLAEGLKKRLGDNKRQVPAVRLIDVHRVRLVATEEDQRVFLQNAAFSAVYVDPAAFGDQRELIEIGMRMHRACDRWCI